MLFHFKGFKRHFAALQIREFVVSFFWCHEQVKAVVNWKVSTLGLVYRIFSTKIIIGFFSRHSNNMLHVANWKVGNLGLVYSLLLMFMRLWKLSLTEIFLCTYCPHHLNHQCFAVCWISDKKEPSKDLIKLRISGKCKFFNYSVLRIFFSQIKKNT